MHLSADISSALQQIETVKKSIGDSDDVKLQAQTGETIDAILNILQDPVFRAIVHIEDSLSELNAQLTQHPSMLPNDFDIDMSGNLVLSVNGNDICEFDSRLSTSLSSLLEANSTDDGKAGKGNNNLHQHGNAGIELFPTDYVQIEAIELVNDGTGLGFGIIGARTSGVIVKTILPSGVADRDGRLRSGDHILQIGDVNLQEMVSEQVAAVLRQSGTHVRLVVGRAIDQPLPEYNLQPNTAIVPARILVDRNELERYLISIGYPQIFADSSNASSPQNANTNDQECFIYKDCPKPDEAIDLLELPETETLEVELTKDENGLGVTIAGYVCEKEELSGIFVKSVSVGSAADLNGSIYVNDRIIEVDGQSLQGFSNHQAVELLKKSGQVVKLRLERYLRGPKFEQLQQAIAANDKIPNSSPMTSAHNVKQQQQPALETSQTAKNIDDISTFFSANPELSLSLNDTNILPIETKSYIKPYNNETILASKQSSSKTSDSIIDSLNSSSKAATGENVNTTTASKSLLDDFLLIGGNKQNSFKETSSTTNDMLSPQKVHAMHFTAEVEDEIIRKWQHIVGPGMNIIVAHIKKFPIGGLGISLEGTVDVEEGREVRPHHYVRSILADGPVGLNGKLSAGDELLEVNGERLYGMNHLEVVAILKELPQDVIMVCGRRNCEIIEISDNSDRDQLNTNFVKMVPASERLVKAKSDGNLATPLSTNVVDTFKLKSRSLEPLTGLAMWSSEPQIIELIKGDRGLGFSILDYQDPMDSNDCLIIIRSLVPGGVAQLDGRLIPGDRLLFVNSINLENASLDQAVQALKGAPKGVVRIGVAKPLPMADTSLKVFGNNNYNTATTDSQSK